MTAADAKRAANLLKTIAEAQEWIETIDESADGKEAFIIDAVEFGKFEREYETTLTCFSECHAPIPMFLAREMFVWLIARCDTELGKLGVTR